MSDQTVKPLDVETSNKESVSTDPERLSALDARKLWAWNRLLLPLMIGMVVVLTLFFFAASMFQLYALQENIAGSPRLDLAATLDTMSVPEQGRREAQKALQRWKTLSLLEEHAMKQRYHQANVLLMARVWVRYLGFVTGMILALVGAVFVLGKMRESRTELSAGTKGHQGKISTNSPGLILASLGTLLMVTTLVTRHQIQVNDEPLYMMLPFSRVEWPVTAKPAPEDVMNLGRSAGQQQAREAGATPATEAAATGIQENLDQSFNQIDTFINTEDQ